MDKKALFKISYGLFVLSACENEKDNGCIINTLQQLTDNPLRVAVTVNKLNYTHDMVLRTGVFNVSMLTEKTSFEMIKHFGFQSGRNVDKFENGTTAMRAENGVYYVTQAVNSYVSCTVERTLDLGSHTMFIASVEDAAVFSDDPSLTYTYYQEHIKPKPQPKTNEKVIWRCMVCGYEYNGDPIPEDYICPLCKHGVADFERVVL